MIDESTDVSSYKCCCFISAFLCQPQICDHVLGCIRDGEDEGEEERRQRSQKADEDEAIEADDEVTFQLIGPYKVPAKWEVVPEETAWSKACICSAFEVQVNRARMIMQLFEQHPDGWCDGMFTHRCKVCKRQGQWSDVYTFTYDDDGSVINHHCERKAYGTKLGKKRSCSSWLS